jgi:hypothetical protein
MTITCTSIETSLRNLRTQRTQQLAVLEAIPHGPGYDAAQEQLGRIEADIAATERELADCEAAAAAHQAEPGPLEFSGRVTELRCHQARRELKHDEPYVLIATFDLANMVNVVGIPVPIPEINVTLVGPWANVDKDETHSVGELAGSSRPDFWGTEGTPQPISARQDVLFLVAMMEHDGSSPDAIRGALRTALRTAMANNLNRAYGSLVDTMISNMQATIETSTGLGLGPSGLNPDDLIARPKHLNLTVADVAALNDCQTVEKSRRFKTVKANGNVVNDYTVSFSFGL